MKPARILQEKERGNGPRQQLEIEAIIASSPSVLGPGQLFIPPFYSLVHVPGLAGWYPADRLLHESLEAIDAHLVDQLCCGLEGGEVVPARLYNFLSVGGERALIEEAQIVHLYEHLLLHPLTRFRRVRNRHLQARTHGSVIFFDNTFTEEGDTVCEVVWEQLAAAFHGQPYPSVQDLDALLDATLARTEVATHRKTAL